MERHSSLAFALTLGLAVAAAMSLAPRAAAEGDQAPVVRAPTIVRASQRLLLVFHRETSRGGNPGHYRVVESAVEGTLIGQHMNGMALEGYLYRAGIPISPSPVPLPRAVGVPGVTSDILGVGSVAGRGRPELLLLVFYRASGLTDYRVLESSTQADEVARHMNELAPQKFHYHTTIVLSDTVVAGAPLARDSSAVGVGVPGFTSNVLGDGIILQNGEMRVDSTPWVRRAGTGSQYRVIRAGTWLGCEVSAREQGAHLVTINDADEQEWLRETYGGKLLWIGLTDQAAEGVWRWASGEESGYTNWATATHEPSNQWASGEHFAHMNWGRDGQWNDLGPASPEWSRVTHGIIEKPAVE